MMSRKIHLTEEKNLFSMCKDKIVSDTKKLTNNKNVFETIYVED